MIKNDELNNIHLREEAQLNMKAINSDERFGIMLLVATAFHAIIILTVGFAAPDLKEPDKPLPKMDIILVHHSSDKKNEKADYLAQSNQEGGGNQIEKVKPKSPNSTPNILPVEGDAQERKQISAPQETAEIKEQLLTQRRSRVKVAKPIEQDKTPVKVRVPTAEELVLRATELARLSSEIDNVLETQAKQPEHKYISASTQEYEWASYMEGWRHKIERVGNLNYPDAAVRSKLYGNLILDVALNDDGTIYNVKVRKSSGHKVLDDAAVRITRLAAPFSKLPDNLKKQQDVLHIVRTWQFMKNRQLKTYQ